MGERVREALGERAVAAARRGARGARPSAAGRGARAGRAAATTTPRRRSRTPTSRSTSRCRARRCPCCDAAAEAGVAYVVGHDGALARRARRARRSPRQRIAVRPRPELLGVGERAGLAGARGRAPPRSRLRRGDRRAAPRRRSATRRAARRCGWRRRSPRGAAHALAKAHLVLARAGETGRAPAGCDRHPGAARRRQPGRAHRDLRGPRASGSSSCTARRRAITSRAAPCAPRPGSSGGRPGLYGIERGARSRRARSGGRAVPAAASLANHRAARGSRSAVEVELELVRMRAQAHRIHLASRLVLDPGLDHVLA